ncbi:hybrid sensor histidine kinase/response regulator transcription factor [uncultured Bacteroides sp.]|jgi:signal transduction histidine kinase/ligand-binding sensor domain-containing protein/DNA-binding response OmpR family regulator|uniref:hybrid sensor histidine kinase/response regulator transcription factor n=1 Tax=uncultured Bacteroides sp. TaxID=162156 RepID=UPI00258E3D63|nr:hybrid sensor histidine kinase/response regulator transcription factor [uncultured Bacteroides sp.]
MKKHPGLLFVLCLICGQVLSENTRFYDSGQLSCNLITNICQDNRGFIWVGTEYGLNKFDGVQFTQYLNQENDTTSLLNNIIRSLMVDKDHRLWVGCSNGLQYYIPEKDAFRTVPFEGNLSPSVTQIYQLRTGEIWLLASSRGIFAVDVENGKVRPLNELTKKCGTYSINRLYEDRFNRIWISTDKEGLVCLSPDRKQAKVYTVPELPAKSVSVVTEDKEGNLYIVVAGTVMRLDEADNRFVQVESYDGVALDIRDMTLDKNGRVYISTYGKGVFYIDREKQMLFPVETFHSPFFNVGKAKVVSMIEDRSRNLWLGCFQKGLLMIPNRPMSFSFWDLSEKGNEQGGSVTLVYRDGEGFVWGGLEGGGLFKFDGRGEVVSHFATPQTVVSMFEDSNHTFWVGTYYNGLAMLDTRTGQSRFIPQFAGQRIKSIVEDSRKNLYISVFGVGMKGYRLSTGEVWELAGTAPETKGLMKNRWINVLLCDSKDLIWIGNYKGISCYDARNDRYMKIEGDSILDKCVCYSLLEDHDGNIWIGTNNGLYVWNRLMKTFKRYSTEDGLSNNVICGLAEDKEGNIWCSTFRGINQVKTGENRIVNYYTGNGLIDKEFSRGVYFHDKEDHIYFGGNYGITHFLPDMIRPTEFDKEVMITNMYLDNRPVTAQTRSGGNPVIDGILMDAGDFYLSHEDNTFTFEFSTMDFREAENIHYEYRLKELSLLWNNTLPGVNRITYSHLSPGNYTLEVRACENGAYTPVKEVYIHIAPPWYRTTIAYICYILMLIAIGMQIYYMLKRRRREEINEEKLKFFINISHEIRSPMTMIISPLESLLRQDYDETTSKALRSMYKNANRIVSLINQLLDIRKIDKGQMRISCSETDLVGFIDDLFQTFDYQSGKRNIHFTFEHEQKEFPVWIDRNNFDKVLVNILSNAFKYTPDNGEITVRLTTGSDRKATGALRNYAEITVLDTGEGIDEGKLEKIFERFYQASADLASAPIGFGIGLNLCRLLVNLHHGTIVASNRKDRKGSCFVIRIPLGNSHLKKEEMADRPAVSRIVLQAPSYELMDEPGKKKSGRSKTHYKVLVVDDDEDVREFLQAELGGIYRVLTCRNAIEGLQVALKQQPDVIVSDVVMPEMDGFTLVRKLKSNGNTSHIPVVLLTSRTEHADRIQGLDKGADAYLTKPFVVEELATMISSLITNRMLLKGKFSGAQDQEDKVKSVEMKSSDEILMERVMKVVNSHLDNSELNVEMLAEQVGLSRVQLHRRLKELTGIPASEFIRNIRLKQAAILLRDKKMNISQVAYAVGFTNHTHFSTAFKKFYGVSPTDYIANAGKE